MQGLGLLAPFSGAAAPLAVHRFRWSLDCEERVIFKFAILKSRRCSFSEKATSAVFPVLLAPFSGVSAPLAIRRFRWSGAY